MAFDFPSSPSLNQIYSFAGKSWRWNGVAWKVDAINAGANLVGATHLLESFSSSFNGTLTSFNLVLLGDPFTPGSITDLEVYVNDVRQEPLEAFTLSGSQITFSVAPTTGQSCYVIATEFSPAVSPVNITIDDISSLFDGVETSFEMLVALEPYPVNAAVDISVYLGGIRQQPVIGYDVTESTIIFSEAPTAGTGCYIIATEIGSGVSGGGISGGIDPVIAGMMF
jgi:hypothetical protein